MITLTLEDSDSGTVVTKTFDSGDTWMEIAEGLIYSLRGLTFEIPGDVEEYAKAWERLKDGDLCFCDPEECGCADEDDECGGEACDGQMELDFDGKN